MDKIQNEKVSALLNSKVAVSLTNFMDRTSYSLFQKARTTIEEEILNSVATGIKNVHIPDFLRKEKRFCYFRDPIKIKPKDLIEDPDLRCAVTGKKLNPNKECIIFLVKHSKLQHAVSFALEDQSKLDYLIKQGTITAAAKNFKSKAVSA